MKKYLCLFLLMFLVMSLKAQNWKPISTSISFKTKMLGVTVDGHFSGFVGTIRFNPNDLTTASLVGSVEAGTVDTDNSLRNKHLKEKEEFFQVLKYPTLKMKSIKIEREGTNYVGVFELTMKGITKAIRMPFTFKQEGNVGVFDGHTTINRKEWAVGGSTFGMSSDVTISILIKAVQN